MRNQFKKLVQIFLAAAAMFFLLIGPVHSADNFFLYGNQGATNISDVDIPPVIDSWFTAVDFFRDGPNEGKMLAATGRWVYIQAAVGSSEWIKVGEVNVTMDPSFIKISPSGEQVALGMGYYGKLLVFNASVLDAGTPEAPVDLIASEQVKKFYENCYDAAWVGETHLVINGDWWVEYGVSLESGVAALDIRNEDNWSVPVCGIIPGSSSGIAVDQDNNLYFGIGYSENRTGEIKVWPANTWWSDSRALGMEMAYDGPEGFIIAEGVLSAAYLGFDGEGNLHVGRGPFGTSYCCISPPSEEAGFAALINHRLLDEARAFIADPTVGFSPLADAGETQGDYYREFAPDPCMNDTVTGILAMGDSISVFWNPTNTDCNIGGGDDYWGPGVHPKLTTYTIDPTRDGDNDGVLDVADWSPNIWDATNADADNDGYGNIIDADFNNDDLVELKDFLYFRNNYQSADPITNMNSDGIVDLSNTLLFQKQYGETAPYYNF